jgi:hypothetical protein
MELHDLLKDGWIIIQGIELSTLKKLFSMSDLLREKKKATGNLGFTSCQTTTMSTILFYLD